MVRDIRDTNADLFCLMAMQKRVNQKYQYKY